MFPSDNVATKSMDVYGLDQFWQNMLLEPIKFYWFESDKNSYFFIKFKLTQFDDERFGSHWVMKHSIFKIKIKK